jgi:hypothetical protein
MVSMEYSFASTRELRLNGLQFPFPLRWRAERGNHRLLPLNGKLLSGRHGEVRVKPEQRFDVAVMPDLAGAAVGCIVLDCMSNLTESAPDWYKMAVEYAGKNQNFGLTLAQSMFFSPEYSWSLTGVAERLKIEPRAIQMALFRESYSFASTLRRCRRLRKLLSVMGAEPLDVPRTILCGRVCRSGVTKNVSCPEGSFD